MSQEKIGSFIRELRKEQGLTREQLAEELGVSNRSISRWENGVNMPDFDLVIALANFFGITVGELLDATRKEAAMERDREEAMLQIANYGSSEKLLLSRRLRYILIAGLVALGMHMFLQVRGLAEIDFYNNLGDFLLGLAFGALVTGVIYTSRHITKIRAFKLRITGRSK